MTRVHAVFLMSLICAMVFVAALVFTLRTLAWADDGDGGQNRWALSERK
jgi:hypothetical protein